jgi:hypothetical protein
MRRLDGDAAHVAQLSQKVNSACARQCFSL